MIGSGGVLEVVSGLYVRGQSEFNRCEYRI